MTRALPPTETSRALLSHTLARLPIKLWPHFFTRTSTSSVHQLNHPTRNQPSKLPRTFINRLQNAVRIIESRTILAIALAIFPDINGSSRAPDTARYNIIREPVTDAHPVLSTPRTLFPSTSDSTRTLTRTTPVFGRLYDQIDCLACLYYPADRYDRALAAVSS